MSSNLAQTPKRSGLTGVEGHWSNATPHHGRGRRGRNDDILDSYMPRRFVKTVLLSLTFRRLRRYQKPERGSMPCGLRTQIVNCSNFPHPAAPVGSQECEEETATVRTQLAPPYHCRKTAQLYNH